MRHRFSIRIGLFLFFAFLIFWAGYTAGKTGRILAAVSFLIWAACCMAFLYKPVRKQERERGLQPDLEELKGRYDKAVTDRQAQINMLQGQINPHFLYNTLECMRSEAILQGCDSIARMSKALAAFFRYSISRKEQVVTLQDELNNIRNYFLIQEYRFENKFSLKILVEEGDEEVFGYPIPKMTLQPIVENAIFHGLETKPDRGRVKIRVFTTQDKVILVVSDDGAGIGRKELERIRSRLAGMPEEEEEQGQQGSGIALYNVNQRIKLFFGEEYGIFVYSTAGEGTDVEILLPKAEGGKR